MTKTPDPAEMMLRLKADVRQHNVREAMQDLAHEGIKDILGKGYKEAHYRLFTLLMQVYDVGRGDSHD